MDSPAFFSCAPDNSRESVKHQSVRRKCKLRRWEQPHHSSGSRMFNLTRPLPLFPSTAHSYLAYLDGLGPGAARNVEMSVTPNHIHFDAERL